MKRNYEDKALRMARFARHDSVPQAGRCLICRLWKKRCYACKARNGDGQSGHGLSARELAQRVLDGRL
jgi:hypothetical protein